MGKIKGVKNVRTTRDVRTKPPVVISRGTLPYKNHERETMSGFEQLQAFRQLIKKSIAYIKDALGITPEEPPIISDHPPIHSVDGQIHLGEAITKGEQQ